MLLRSCLTQKPSDFMPADILAADGVTVLPHGLLAAAIAVLKSIADANRAKKIAHVHENSSRFYDALIASLSDESLKIVSAHAD